MADTITSAIKRTENSRAKEAFDRVLPFLGDHAGWAPGGDKLQVHHATLAASKLSALVSRHNLAPLVDKAAQSRFGYGLDKYLERVNDLAWAVRYARTRLIEAGAQNASEAMPEDLINRAAELRGRMFMVINTHLSTPESLELDAAMANGGYDELPKILRYLAALYMEHGVALRRSEQWFRTGDAGEALKLAREMEKICEVTEKDVRHWASLQARIHASLCDAFNQLRELAVSALPEHRAELDALPKLSDAYVDAPRATTYADHRRSRLLSA